MSRSFLLLLILSTCSCTPSSRLNELVDEARSRSYGTVCSETNGTKYCIVAYNYTTPKVAFSFDDCLKKARSMKDKNKRLDHGEWCVCMANDYHLDLGIALYNCGVRDFKVINERDAQ